jgi:hypothetical protein
MQRQGIRGLFPYVLAVYLLFDAIASAFPSSATIADYMRWGYPSWLHYVVAFLKFNAVGLLLISATRLAGALLSAFIMISAAGILTFHEGFVAATPAVAAFAFAAAVAYATAFHRPQPVIAEIL